MENKTRNTKSFTLLEVLTVIIIIGILATLGLVNYTKTRENTFDKEAITILKVMQAAEKDYYLDNSKYAICADNATCNSALGLFISSKQWKFRASIDGSCAASRENPPVGYNRVWNLGINDAEPYQ